MGRYFKENEGDTNSKETVFHIDDKVIGKVKKRQDFQPHKFKANKYKKAKKRADPFPGKKPVDPAALAKHSHGDGVSTEKVRTKFKQKEQARREEKITFAEEQSARTEILLQEEAGYLEGDEEQEFTGQIKQEQIKRAVDEVSASKCFDLNLGELGPYKTSPTGAKFEKKRGKTVCGGADRSTLRFGENVLKLFCAVSISLESSDVEGCWLLPKLKLLLFLCLIRAASAAVC